MSDVYRKDGFTPDDRVRIGDDEPLDGRPVFVSKARFLAERDGLAALGRDIGLILEPSDRLDDLAEAIPTLGAIAVRFPKFNDGRGYSLARLLRDRYAFTGELRAVGDILFDQIEAFFRVGFDTLEIEDALTRSHLLATGAPASQVRYQPGGEPGRPIPRRPWASSTR